MQRKSEQIRTPIHFQALGAFIRFTVIKATLTLSHPTPATLRMSEDTYIYTDTHTQCVCWPHRTVVSGYSESIQLNLQHSTLYTHTHTNTDTLAFCLGLVFLLEWSLSLPITLPPLVPNCVFLPCKGPLTPTSSACPYTVTLNKQEIPVCD